MLDLQYHSDDAVPSKRHSAGRTSHWIPGWNRI